MSNSNDYGFNLNENDISNALKDLENYTLQVDVLLDRYSLDYPRTRFVMFNNQLHGVKVVLHHAYFLKHGKTNKVNPTSDIYESILRKIPSSGWEIIETED